MFKNIIFITIIAALLAAAPIAIGQKSTEISIPIGKSPGLSGKYTVMGTIEDVNHQNRTLTMSHESNRYTVTITDQTMFFLDKSLVRQSNSYGSMADCKKGMTVEVKFEDNMRSKPAEWIKLRIG